MLNACFRVLNSSEITIFLSDRFDYDWFNDPRHFASEGSGEALTWDFLESFIGNFLKNVLYSIQRIGILGALISFIITCMMMMLYSTNKKEMTKHVKNFVKILIAFALLVSIVSWVSLFQQMLGMDTFYSG